MEYTYSMDIMEKADNHIWEFLQEQEQATEYISIDGTLESLLADGWTPTEIDEGEADEFITDHIVWLD